MKILCVIDSLGSGGAQRQITQLAFGFKEIGHSVHLLTYHNDNFYASFLTENSIKVTCLEEENYLFRILKIRRFLRSNDFNAVLSFLEGANFICELSTLPTKRWTLVVGERNANENILSSFKLRVFRYFHFFADFVVSNSNANLDLVKKANGRLHHDKLKVVYNIVDLDIWKPSLLNVHNSENQIKILVLASQIYRKNLKGLVEALIMLDKFILDRISITWYGDFITPPFYDNSFQEANEMISSNNLKDKFSFHAAVPNINERMSEFDVIGLFSYNEGLPNAVCEGMACGKPILCSSISDIPTILKHQRELTFNPNSPLEISKAITHFCNLEMAERIRIGKLNREFAENNFSKIAITRSYLKMLENE